MKIYLGADHGGFELKEKVKIWLQRLNYQVEDCGAFSLDENDDYPDFAFEVARKVAKGGANERGILFCRSGGGMVIAANRLQQIRAVDAYDQRSAKHARTDNDANVISIGADWIDFVKVKEIIQVFLETEFDQQPRHIRRIKKISNL